MAEHTLLMAGRRVWVVGAFDSFFKAARRYATALSHAGAQVDHQVVLARVGQLSASQREYAGVPDTSPTLPLDSIAKRAVTQQVDVVLLALDGLRTRRFVLAVREAARAAGTPPPVLVSFYPGLIFRFHLEGMMSRSSCDLVLLNSASDQALYQEAMAAIGEPDNSMLAGLSFLGSPSGSLERAHPRNRVVFAGQPTVPASEQERRYVVHALAKAAERWPKLEWVIKPRHRPNETTLHKVRYHYEEIFASLPNKPPNLRVSYEPLESQFASAVACITFSSTAALEAVARGVPARVLTDLGIHENHGNHFFLGSDMFGCIDDVAPNIELRLNSEWAARHMNAPENLERRFLERIEALLRERTAGRPHRHEQRLFGRSSDFDRFNRSDGRADLSAEFGAAKTPAIERGKRIARRLSRLLLR